MTEVIDRTHLGHGKWHAVSVIAKPVRECDRENVIAKFTDKNDALSYANNKSKELVHVYIYVH